VPVPKNSEPPAGSCALQKKFFPCPRERDLLRFCIEPLNSFVKPERSVISYENFSGFVDFYGTFLQVLQNLQEGLFPVTAGGPVLGAAVFSEPF